MEYTVQVTVRVYSDTVNDAHRIIKHALERARLAEIIYVDSEVIESKVEEDEVDFFSEDDMRASSLWNELRNQ